MQSKYGVSRLIIRQNREPLYGINSSIRLCYSASSKRERVTMKLLQKLHKVIMGLAKHIIIKPFNPSDSQESE